MEQLQEVMEADYEIGSVIKEKLIPHAVHWFTGEALQMEEEDDDDEDDDEEGDDEEDDGEEGGAMPAVRPPLSTMQLLSSWQLLYVNGCSPPLLHPPPLPLPSFRPPAGAGGCRREAAGVQAAVASCSIRAGRQGRGNALARA